MVRKKKDIKETASEFIDRVKPFTPNTPDEFRNIRSRLGLQTTKLTETPAQELTPPTTTIPEETNKPRIEDTTVTQQKASKQGVPVEAFKRADETKAEFQARIRAEPRAQIPLTAEQVRKEEERRQSIASSLGQEVIPTETIPPQIGAGGTLLEAGKVVGAGVAGATVGAGFAGATAGLSIPAGFVLGAGAEILRQISSDKKQVTTNSIEVFGRAQGRYTEILNFANKGVFEQSDLVLMYNQDLANAREAERVLSYLLDTKTGTSYKKASDELNEVRAWLALEPQRRQRLIQALQAPDPTVQYQTVINQKTQEPDLNLFG